ncbi:MAG: carboxypeptidase-like regulatory domain-containing protein [Acidobacteriia bacterium]|nr:carboxypeptidase-like regulatory domain-containing protein [Terriglobia bacterium]
MTRRVIQRTRILESAFSYTSRISAGFFVLALAIAFLSVPQAQAQTTGSIHGSVTDPNGAVIPGAAVSATNKGTDLNRRVTTNPEGSFGFENLPPGQYDVRAEQQGFTSQLQAVTVQVGTNTTVNFAMTLGSTSQTVEVSDAAVAVNTMDSVVGGVMNQQRVDNLPLNGRSFLSIAALQPGVTVSYVNGSGPTSPNSFFNVSVAGAPTAQTTISFDGARVNDRITGGTSQNFSSESVQEFQIQTFGFDLASGTVSTGAVNVISRSGSNELHGSGFFFFRDHNMAAFSGLKRPTDPTALNPACLVPTSSACHSLQDPYFVRKQFGGSIGGPIIKDRLFFFGNYERNDQIGATTVAFSDPLLYGWNHVAKQPLAGHLAGVKFDYRINANNQLFVRGNIDSNHAISPSSSGALESTWDASSNFANQAAMGLTTVISPTLVNDFKFSYSYWRNHLSGPTQAECLAIASGISDYCFGAGSTRVTYFGGLTIGNDINVPQDRNPRTYQVTDGLTWIKGAHRFRFGVNLEENVSHGSWSRNLQGSFAAIAPATLQAANPAIYNALPASLHVGATGLTPTFAELNQLPVTGSLTIGFGDAGQPVNYLDSKIWHNLLSRAYAQDAWSIRKGVTLTYGLGWSHETNLVFHNTTRSGFLAPLLGASDLGTVPSQYRDFDPTVGLAWSIGKSQRTVIRAGASLHHASGNVDYLTLQDLVLNAPAGIGLTQSDSTGIANPKAGQPGQPATLNFTTPVQFTAADMLNYLPTIKAQVAAAAIYTGKDLSIRNVDVVKTVQGPQLNDIVLDQSFKTPYTFQVNLGVQREILPRTVLSVDYVMSRAVHFGVYEGEWVDLNRFNRIGSYTLAASGTATVTRNPVLPQCTAAQAKDPRAECSLGGIDLGEPGMLSRYQSLQFQLNRGMSHGLQFSTSYALTRNKGFTGINNYDNLFEGYGTVGGTRTHRVTASAIWQVPAFNGGNAFVRQVVNGWQLSTSMDMASGAPISVRLGSFDVNGDGTRIFNLPGTGNNTFGGDTSIGDIRKLVDAYNATYPAPPNTPLSTIGRANRDTTGSAYPYVVLPDNFQPADSFLTHDLRITRTFALAERFKLLLIGEAFNLFNIANLTGYSGTLQGVVRPTTAAGVATNPTFTFGIPTSRVNPVFGSGGPRALQVAARITF